MKRKLIIGINGSRRQIQHISTLLKKKYDVIDLESILEEKKPKIIKHIEWILKLRHIDILYNVYTSNTFYKKVEIAKFLNKKVITHWIGTDVDIAIHGGIKLEQLHNVNMHLVCFGELQEELSSLNIDSIILPIVPSNLSFDVCNMPQEHVVLIYMPEGKENYYGFEDLKIIFGKYSDLQFLIVANSNREKFVEWRNVNPIGVLSIKEMEELYNKVSIIIRYTKHDGLSMSILEALAKGKEVIWNKKINNIHYVTSVNEICTALNLILRDSPRVNLDGHNYVMNFFSREKILYQYNKVFECVINNINRDCGEII